MCGFAGEKEHDGLVMAVGLGYIGAK